MFGTPFRKRGEGGVAGWGKSTGANVCFLSDLSCRRGSNQFEKEGKGDIENKKTIRG